MHIVHFASRCSSNQSESDTESLNIRLLGLIVTPDAVVARIADEVESKVNSLRQGEDFQDWTVIAIDSGSLKLSRNGEIRTFSVFAKSSETQNMAIAAKPGSGVDHPAAPDTTQPTRIIAKARSPEQDLVDFFGPAKGNRQSP